MLAFRPWELNLLLHIQEIRSLGLDQFFIFINYFDTAYFYVFFLFPFIWVGYDWKAGIKLTAILLISFLVNGVLKEVLAQPRPFHVDPQLAVIKVKGYGFPSGAAQSALLLAGIFIQKFYTKWWSWTIGIVYVALISFSRLYLGVHFPSDIFGGWLIGFVLFAIYFKIFPYWCRLAEKYPYYFLLFMGVVFPIIVYFSLPTSHVAGPIAAIITLAAGLALAIKQNWLLPKTRYFSRGLLRAFICIIAFIILYVVYHFALIPAFGKDKWGADVLFFAMVGLWLSIGNYFFCRWIPRLDEKKE